MRVLFSVAFERKEKEAAACEFFKMIKQVADRLSSHCWQIESNGNLIIEDAKALDQHITPREMKVPYGNVFKKKKIKKIETKERVFPYRRQLRRR